MFSKRLTGLDFDKDILPIQEVLLSDEYGFEMYEIKHIVNYKPTIFLIEEEYKSHKGIKALKEVLINEFGFDLRKVRNLVVRYPQVLSKTND